MKIKNLAAFLTVLISCPLLAETTSGLPLLPNPFPVYTNGNVVVNHPYPGFIQKMLPTNNDYVKNPGCYVACYSHDPKNSIYSVTSNIFVKGQIRVPGTYVDRTCVPSKFVGKDISASLIFKDLCNSKIKTCTDCWAGGDTGGWYGY